jgi:hypothetical protein
MHIFVSYYFCVLAGQLVWTADPITRSWWKQQITFHNWQAVGFSSLYCAKVLYKGVWSICCFTAHTQGLQLTKMELVCSDGPDSFQEEVWLCPVLSALTNQATEQYMSLHCRIESGLIVDSVQFIHMCGLVHCLCSALWLEQLRLLSGFRWATNSIQLNVC